MTKNQKNWTETETDRWVDHRKTAGGTRHRLSYFGRSYSVSTYWYIHQRILAQNLSAEMIPGVPSFCAVAAKLNLALAEADQPIHILPASYPSTEAVYPNQAQSADENGKTAGTSEENAENKRALSPSKNGSELWIRTGTGLS